jgi:hypothetical protein
MSPDLRLLQARLNANVKQALADARNGVRTPLTDPDTRNEWFRMAGLHLEDARFKREVLNCF